MTERIDNSNLENRAMSFIDSVKQNIQNELSDIFDDEPEKPLYMTNSDTIKFGGSIVSAKEQNSTEINRGDIVMNLQGSGRNRRTRERCRVRKTRRVKRSTSSVECSPKNTTSYYTDTINETNDTSSKETAEVEVSDVEVSDVEVSDVEVSDVEVSDVEVLDIEERNSEEYVRDSIVDFQDDSEDENKDLSCEESETPCDSNIANDDADCQDCQDCQEPRDLSEILEQEIQELLAQYPQDEPEKLEEDGQSDIDTPEKNEINITCADNTYQVDYILSTKDLNTDSILEQIMSTTNDKLGQVQTLIERLREITDVNKDLDAIMKLGVHDKLWVEKTEETIKNADGEKESREIPRLVVHETATGYVGAIVRTYHGQGREDILAHLRGIVESIERHTQYEDIVSKRTFIPLYVAKIHQAADKIEKQILNQYTDHKEEIENFINKMRTSADTMREIHESSNGTTRD
jgi:hypothetical protein